MSSASTLKETLKSVPLLQRFGSDKLEKLGQQMQTRNFKAGDFLMKQGEVGNEFFIIISGMCDVHQDGPDGGKVKIAELETGDYCGEQALLGEADCKRGAHIQAISETKTLVLNAKSFASFAKDAKINFVRRARKAVTAEKLDLSTKIELKEKDPKTKEFLLKAISDNILFHDFSQSQKVVVTQLFKEKKVEKGEVIIAQGDHGEVFYVVGEGAGFDVHVKDVGLVQKLATGQCVGELALLYNAPRAATVSCTSAGIIWEVARGQFRKALAQDCIQHSSKQLKWLAKVPLLQPLTSGERKKLSGAFSKEKFKAGTTVIKQGDRGEKFYIIYKGKAMIIKDGKELPKDLGAGEYFGELALLNNEPRKATIKAKSDVSCLVLTQDEFTMLLGPLKAIMERKNYKDKARPVRAIPKAKKTKPCPLDELKTIGILGKGAFGKVTLVKDAKKNSYALKAIKKNQIVEQGQQQHILTEKRVMCMLENPFLCNLICTYKDKYRVYFLLELCLGGELFTILRNRRSFDENMAMYYAACVTEGFHYMHEQDIIYRDLKPENLVLNNAGVCKITDFGFAKVVPDKTFTLCGTPDYLAPEIVTGQGHGKGVDWWTLGILIYEMVASLPPFYADKQMETYRKIVRGKIKFPRCMSREIKDLIGKLLKTKPTKRYGVIKGGTQLIRDHPWFARAKFNWSALQKQTLKAPYVPKLKSNEDLSNFDKYPDEKENLEFKGDMDLGWDDEF